jgi:hypothetical protein
LYNIRREQSKTMEVFNLNILRLHLFLMNCVVVTTSNFWLTKGSTYLVCARNIYRSGTQCAAYRTWTSISRWNNELIKMDIPRHGTSGLSQEFHRGRMCSLPGPSNVGVVTQKIGTGTGFSPSRPTPVFPSGLHIHPFTVDIVYYQ